MNEKIVVRVDNGTEWTFNGTIEVGKDNVLIVRLSDGSTQYFPVGRVLWWSRKPAGR